MSSILLVDDDVALVEALSRELEQLNHKAILTQSADEAIEVLRRVPVDVMVTDLRMRGRDGIELLRHCVELSPRTRTVLMSAYATAVDYKEARALGAVEVLSKPFTPAEFTRAIQRAEEFTAGFQADIVGLSLVDLLQVFHHSRRSVTVRVGRMGKVHLREGEIVHAETEAQAGGEALMALLKVERGVLATGAVEPVPQTLSLPFETLLLGTLAHMDEQRDRGLTHGLDPESIVRAMTSTPPAQRPPESALAVAVAASTPPIKQSPPRATGEIPRVEPAEPVYLLETPRSPPPAPDYWMVGGLLMLFIATLILTLFRPGTSNPPAQAHAARPALPPALAADNSDEVVDPYQASAGAWTQPRRVRLAQPTSNARLQGNERPIAVEAPRSVLSAAPAPVQPAAPLTAGMVAPRTPATVAPVSLASVAPASAPPSAAPPPVAIAPSTVPAVAPVTMAAPVSRPVPQRRVRRPKPVRRAAWRKAPAVEAPASTAPRALRSAAPQPVPINRPTVELID